VNGKAVAVPAAARRLIEIGTAQEVPTSWTRQLTVIFAKLFGAVGTDLHAEYLALSPGLRKRLVRSFNSGIRGWNVVHDSPSRNRLNASRIHEADHLNLVEPPVWEEVSPFQGFDS
jgi:hypothetical protein